MVRELWFPEPYGHDHRSHARRGNAVKAACSERSQRTLRPVNPRKHEPQSGQNSIPTLSVGTITRVVRGTVRVEQVIWVDWLV
jgi:hypothetical protein